MAVIGPGQWKAFEDVAVGDTFSGMGRTITDADILFSSALTTGFGQPLHTNAEWVRANTGFRGVILPGPVILAYAVGMLSASLVYSPIVVAALGFDRVRAAGPVYAGDTLTANAEVASARRTSNGRNGVLEFSVTVTKQDGSTAMTFLYTLMVRTREPEPAGA